MERGNNSAPPIWILTPPLMFSSLVPLAKATHLSEPRVPVCKLETPGEPQSPGLQVGKKGSCGPPQRGA